MVTIKVPVLPLAQLDVAELDLALELVADPDLAVEGEGRACIHAPRHRDLGQHAAGEGRTVAPQLPPGRA